MGAVGGDFVPSAKIASHRALCSTLLKFAICAPPCASCACRLGHGDVGPCATHPAAGVAKVASAQPPHAASCVSPPPAGNLDLRGTVLAARVQGEAEPRSGRGLRSLERAPAAWHLTAPRRRWPCGGRKSRFFAGFAKLRMRRQMCVLRVLVRSDACAVSPEHARRRLDRMGISSGFAQNPRHLISD